LSAVRRLQVGDRVRVGDGRCGVVVDASYEASDSILAPLWWLGWLLGRPAPQKHWYYQVSFDGQAMPGYWWHSDLLEPEVDP